MQSLRDQLMKAGLVTREQADKAEAAGKRGPRRGGGGSRERGERREGGAPGAAPAEAQAAPTAPRPPPRPQAKKGAEKPVRLLDLSDPSRLRILQAIEANRVREETQGEEQFFFPLRDGRLRKLFVNAETVARLESGGLAIVENGEAEKHVLVLSEAVAAIRAVDPEAVRFHNAS
jgi:uncharacterized protein YaiL (DUF2058 family)